MRKTTLNIDDEKLAAAAAALGTHGLKQTIDRALDEAIAARARRQVVAQLVALDDLELADGDVMARAWR